MGADPAGTTPHEKEIRKGAWMQRKSPPSLILVDSCGLFESYFDMFVEALKGYSYIVI
jgi:hypothetical protein